MKEVSKKIANSILKNSKKENKLEKLVLQLALKNGKGTKVDERGVVYSKGGKRLLMADKTIEGTYSIAENTEIIESDAFWGCSYLEQIIIPESITTIGDEAFSRCISLKNIVIPASVTKIGANPFYDMLASNIECKTSAYKVEGKNMYNAEMTQIVACLSDASMIILPSTVTTIGDKSFTRRRKLKKVVIPSSVEIIGDAAFSDCDALEEVTIPASVQTISKFAFAECDKLKKVTFQGDVKKLSKTTFLECDSLREICVPAGSGNKFKKALRIIDEDEVIITECKNEINKSEKDSDAKEVKSEKKENNQKAPKKKSNNDKGK